jgi:glycosyltransferase involved in cell wall biosynthesis
VSRIKILYVCAALNRGSGGEMHPLALARYLDQDKFDFAVCAIGATSFAVMSKMEQSGRPLYSLGLSRRFYNPLNSVRIIYRLSRLFCKIEPDIVQTHGLHANLLARPAARWAGVGVIISTENALPDIERNPLRRAFNAPLHGLNRLLDRNTRGIVVVSECVRQWKDPLGRSEKIRVIAPPFRLDAFGMHRPREARVMQGRAPVLGVVGRLSPEKGHRVLIAAMPEILARAPRARLLVVGSGPLEAELRAQVETLGLTESVQFLGYMQAVEAAFSRMDILIVPSLSEAFSLVTLEGMMMELPVVASRSGGPAEIVLDGETGLLVPPGDSSALAEACKYLLSNPEVGREMGKCGRKRVLSEFHPSQFIARHERLYLDAVDGLLPGRSCGAS